MVGDGTDEGFGLLACREVHKYVRDEIVKWRKVAIDAKMPREVSYGARSLRGAGRGENQYGWHSLKERNDD